MRKQIDMVNGRLCPGMLSFALPLVLSSVLQVLYHSADTFIIGRYDDPVSMGAVGSASGVISCVTMLFLGISVGVNVLSARFFGAGDFDSVKKYGENAAALGGIFGIIILLLGQICAEPLTNLLGVAPDIRDRTIVYLRIYLFGMPFSSMFNFISAFLQGTGDTINPTRCLMISGATNLIFNIIFVKYFSMGVPGVAFATVISMVVSFVLVYMVFMKSPVGNSARRIKLTGVVCKNIIRVGLPAGLQGVLMSGISSMLSTWAMNSFGAAAVAGEAIEVQVESLLCTGMSAIGAAIVTFTGQNVGAGNYQRLKKILRTGFTVAFIYCIIASAIAYSLRFWIVDLFAHGDAEVSKYALIKFDFIILPFAVMAIHDIPAAMLRGIGETFAAMVIAIFGGLFRAFWIIFLLPLHRTVGFLYLAFPVAWVLCGMIYYITYRIKKRKLVTN